MENKFLHEIAITAIIIKEGKYLITRRALSKKRWPGKWTVPGGKFETDDYSSLPQDGVNQWYNVLERTVRREVKEEVGLDIENISYLTSIAVIHGDGNPSLIISCVTDYAGGEVALQKEECDAFAWITAEEAKDIDFIDGIYDEIVMTEKHQRAVKSEWQRA